MNKSIYKINHIINGNIDTIYIFNGKKNKKAKQDDELNEYFNENDLREINKSKIVYCEQFIHYDDSIGTIKIKILNEFKKSISIDQIYLFCQKIETFNSTFIYQSLTQNKKLSLTKVRLDQFLSNIVSDEIGNKLKDPVEKDIYDYDDIIEMNLDGKKFIVNKVLGQKFFMIENEYPFVCNPYDVHNYDSFLERNSRKSLTTLNSHLLLNTGEIIQNNIFLCLANDVLLFDEKENIPQNLSLKIYYPFLYDKNINNIDDLREKNEELIKQNNDLLNENTFDYFKTVNMFYEIYKLRNNELDYVNKGIKFLKATIRPLYNFNIPLEIIFKTLHATKVNPFIKFNSSSRQENIFRLFTDKIATDGRKIPYLKKALIFKLMKNIGKTKTVSVYLNIDSNPNILTLVCEFDENGYITIHCEFENPISESDINDIFINNINPIIQEISNLLEQSGYKMNFFENLQNNNIEIKQITYQTQIKIKKSINLDSYKGCIYSIFNNESSSFKKNIHLRFKRVANFNKVTSQEAFILEKSSEGYRGHEIIDALLENFPDDLNRNQAEELVKKVANEIELERGVKKTDIKIKDNPGFKTVIALDQISGTITITVENINNIQYLYTIPIYLDSMIRITQDKKSTKFSSNEINKICNSNEKEDIIIQDIISPVESERSEYEIPSIEDIDEEMIHYTKLSDSLKSNEEDRVKTAFDLFYDENELENMDDSEVSSYDESKGGEKSSSNSSESSIASNVLSDNNEINENENNPVNPANVEVNNILKNESIQSTSSLSAKINSPSETTIQYNPEFHDDKELQAEDEELQEEAEELQEEDEELQEDQDNIINIDYLSLKKKDPYFETRIEKLDPVLIVKEDSKEFNSYSRVCSSSEKRQPVILTDKELDKINKEHPGFLRDEDIIKYGSNPNKQFNYICPRYWCLKNNTIVDPKDLKEVIVNGKKELESPNCGYVLPDNAKRVEPGYYVYEFYKPKPGKLNYKKYPGFQVDKHPKGFCLPCCFDKYNTIGRIEANKKCNQKKNNVDDANRKIKEKEQKEDEYVKGPDKFPLLPGKWGYLPIQIQNILNVVNTDCQISKTNTNIKQNHPCLLRHGVEINDKQSFVSCISDLLYFGKRIVDDKNTVKIAKVLTIKEMKELIIKSLDIDHFITYQNGNLVNDFKTTDLNLNSNIDVEKYSTTKLYSKINKSNESEVLYFKKIISAFENFINFLRDDDTIIDHTYLWDLISKPNKNLFPNGINLIIFKIPNDDITSNVELICPTNHYSNEFYEARKPTVILMKEDNYYEPIYSYTNNNNKIQVAKDFKEYDPHLSKTMRTVFNKVIKPFISVMCRPLDSMPNIYKSPRAPLLTELIEKMDKYDYKVVKMVMNFNNKIIGVVAESPTINKSACFVPCFPSSYDSNYGADFVFMTDLSIWRTYDETYTFLTKLHKVAKKKNMKSEIACKPMLKVIEDNLVVGIITETNQFIQLSQPIPEMDIKEEYNLPSLSNNNYLINKNENSDIIITTSNQVDNERVEYIKKIKFESQFYNIFRNTIRILLNDYQNIKIREKIEGEILKDYLIYTQKLNNITLLLKELVKDKIKFIGDSNYYKLINELSTCLVKNDESCKEDNNLCMISETKKNGNENVDNICSLILPKNNLITYKENEVIYFGKMADELIRYSRINSFILQPQTFLSFGNIGYNLRKDEIIMLQSLLTQEYFESLIPAIINNYVEYNSYDEAEPITRQIYDNIVKISDIKEKSVNELKNETCIKKKHNKISILTWQGCFPDNFKEIEYSKNITCTFNCVIDIIEKKTSEQLDSSQIKNVLFEEYKKYLNNYYNKIVDILIEEGKKTLGEQLKNEMITFGDFLYNDNYFLSPFDIWLLVNKYKIPTIFLSSYNLLQTSYEKNIFVAYSDNIDDLGEKYCFLIIPKLRNESIPGYKIVENNRKEYFTSINDFMDSNKNDECINTIKIAIENKIDINKYLEQFQKINRVKTSKPKNKIKLLIETENIVRDDNVDIAKNVDAKLPSKKIKKNLTIESENSEPDEFIIKTKPQTKKIKQIILKGKGSNGTRKNIL
jgi:hypothetical protein